MKTLDIGFRGVSLSTDLYGTILQISAYHPKHGVILAEPYEQFDGTRFRDPLYVRSYRERMLRSVQSDTPGFGIRFAVNASERKVSLEGLGRASVEYHATGGLHIKTCLQVSEDGEVIQASEITTESSNFVDVSYTMDHGISLNRASYGQLTEGGPIPLPPSQNSLKLVASGHQLVIVNQNLGAHLQGVLFVDGDPIDFSGHVVPRTIDGLPVTGEYKSTIRVFPNTRKLLVASFRLRPGVSHDDCGDVVQHLLSRSVPPIWPVSDRSGRFIVRRNLEYILGNCAIPLTPSQSTVCVITDHVALPLGWMRDNYWQMRFLMDVHLQIGALATAREANIYSDLIKSTVKGHLRWVFRFAQRPHRFWHRSYLTTGRPKDGPVFQLDQQCYPLLELCDFWHTFPEERKFVEQILNEDAVTQVLDLIASKQDPITKLFPTDETPGDDEVEYPFHFSSHVLLWRTMTRLADVTAQIGECLALSKRLWNSAQSLRGATLAHFLHQHPELESPVFSYLVDGSGARTMYHDANDIPTLFAHQWGFLVSDVQRTAWHNTMKFGFSKANVGGFYADGPFGGLGSIHTRGPWPLGYFQSWRYAQLIGDEQAESEAWNKICGAMLWDGTFSEAVDGHTGECTSKAWFSWPGSMIGSGLLQDGNRERYL